MGTPITYLSGGTMGYESGIFKNATTALGFVFPLSTSYKWWNGVDVSSQYLLYSDLFSVNQQTVANSRPTAWSTPSISDATLLALINTLPERVGLPGFLSTSEALQWLQNYGTYFLLKDGYESIITTNLQLSYDGGWYNSYNGSGTAVTDLSGNNRTGTLTNGVLFNSNGVGSFGFDGSDDYISVTNFMGNTNTFTVSHWIYLDASQDTRTIFSNYSTAGSGWVTGIKDGTSNVVKFYLGSAHLYSNTTLLNKTWYHVAVTYNNGSPKIYINGSLDASSSDTIVFGSSWYGNDIGRLGVGAQYFNGKISLVQVYTTALSPVQILQNYNVQKSRFGITSPVQSQMVLELDAANTNSYNGSQMSFVGAKIYSSYNGGLRSSNYTVQYSNDNSNWTTAFQGVASNNTSCGIQTNTGQGTGVFARYWRYVEGSAIVSHHPRVSRIMLTDINGVDVNLVVYTADNCTDQGDYIIGTVSADFASTAAISWNDLSANGNEGTLTNGPVFSNLNGGAIVFDGTNDYVLVPDGYTKVMKNNNFWTVSVWVLADSLSNNPVLISPGAGQLGYSDLYLEIGSSNIWMAAGGGPIIATPSLSTGTIYNVTWVKNGTSTGYIYLNGNQLTTTGSGLSSMPNTSADFRIGAFKEGNFYLDGNIYYVSMYNRALTSPQIVQNFYALADRYGAGIVRSGLVLNYDAGNFASYPTSGTTWSDLSSSVFDGELTNGPTYSSNDGGGIVFDGSDDYVNTNQSIASESFTIAAWFKCTNASTYRMLISKESFGGGPWNYRLFLESGTGYLYGDCVNAGSSVTATYNTNLANGSWYYAAFVRSVADDKVYLYVNGTQVANVTDNSSGSMINSQPVWIGRSYYQGGTYPFLGTIAITQIYNRALSSAEITQNYNADKGRFGL